MTRRKPLAPLTPEPPTQSLSATAHAIVATYETVGEIGPQEDATVVDDWDEELVWSEREANGREGHC